jgi:hypothetical protein
MSRASEIWKAMSSEEQESYKQRSVESKSEIMKEWAKKDVIREEVII